MPVEQGQTRIYADQSMVSGGITGPICPRPGMVGVQEIFVLHHRWAWWYSCSARLVTSCRAARACRPAGLLAHISVALANIASVALRIAWRSFDGKRLCRLLAVKPGSIEPEIWSDRSRTLCYTIRQAAAKRRSAAHARRSL